MATKRKHRFNFVKFLIFLIFVYIIGFFIYQLFMMPIKHVRILNAKYLSDQEILKISKLDNYPSFLLTMSSSITKKLKSNPLVKNVKVKKKWFCNVYIYLDEQKVLLYNNSLGQAVLENGKTIDFNKKDVLPQLINSVPEAIYNKLIHKMAEVNNDTLLKISEIEYKPNNVDDERFLLSMNDGNYIYLTLYTFEKINTYIDILPTLEDKKGILYLDSGNYFEIIN